MSEIKKTTNNVCCSISREIEFWSKIRKCALYNPDLPIGFIKELLIAKYQDQFLAEDFIFERDKNNAPD